MASIARVRIACDGANFDGPVNKLDGRRITFWRGSDLRLELAIFSRGTLEDIGNLSAITVQVKPMVCNDVPPPVDVPPAMEKTVKAENWNLSLVPDAWENGADQQIAVEFSAEETAIPSGDAWLVIWAQTAETPQKIIVLSAGRIRVLESSGGAPGAPLPPAPAEQFYGSQTCDTLFARREQNLADLASPSTARENLGLGAAALCAVLDEEDMVSNSAAAVPTQRSSKAYVDAAALEVRNHAAGGDDAVRAYVDAQVAAAVPAVPDSEDLWPTNASHRFSSYAQKPYFTSTGGVCAVDGWYIYNSSTTPVSSSYFASGWNMSEYALPFRKEDIVFYRMIGTVGSGVYVMNRPFTMEETAALVGQTVTISFDIKFGEGFPLEQENYGLDIDIISTTSTDAAVKVNADGTFTQNNSTLATFPEITEGSTSNYQLHNFTFVIPPNITMFNLRLRHTPKLNEDNSTPDDYTFYMGHFTLAIGETPAKFKMKPIWMDVNIHTRRFLRIRSSYKGSTVQSQSYYESLAFSREMEAVPLCIRGVNEVTPVGFGSGSSSSAEEISATGAIIRRDATQTSSSAKWRTTYSFAVIPWVFQNTIPNY